MGNWQGRGITAHLTLLSGRPGRSGNWAVELGGPKTVRSISAVCHPSPTTAVVVVAVEPFSSACLPTDVHKPTFSTAIHHLTQNERSEAVSSSVSPSKPSLVESRMLWPSPLRVDSGAESLVRPLDRSRRPYSWMRTHGPETSTHSRLEI
jgi:hypothetical protein